MADPLLLLPGMMGDARIFLNQVSEFSKDRSVQVAPVTQGNTMEEIAKQVLVDAPPKFALAGHEMGGCVALEVQRLAPDRVTRLALLNSSALAETPPVAASREEKIVKAKSGRLKEVLHDDFRSTYFAPSKQQGEILDYVIEMGLDLGAEAYISQSRAMQKRPDQQKTLRKLRIPTLVLGGAHDLKTPLTRQEFIATLIPYGCLEIVHSAGCLPSVENPTDTNLFLQKWLHQPLVLR